MFKPKCHPYWIIDGVKVINTQQVSVGHSATGHLLPCCWADSIIPENQDLSKFDLLNEGLEIKKHKSLKGIFLSPQWISLHNTLINDPDNAPSVCKRKCNEQ
jgi:hypothetical protein